MMEKIGFFVVAIAMLYSALRVVTTRNLVHSVLWLGLVLASTAVAFLILRAPFLAAMQIILYTGGVLTLMLFGVMLTQRDSGFVTVPNPDRGRLGGALLGGLTFGAISSAAVLTMPKLPNADPVDVSTQALGAAFLTEHVLAFEVLSILLLAAVMGAIVLARRGDPAKEGEHDGPRIQARRRVS
ncbi:MAG: NADH-quinone oxidoreductase subunit J [Deltaproteobacteria bacterium]|nr:NADH-quinone oxidoreductase subunit J [Deltaproteobacteria bacterium]